LVQEIVGRIDCGRRESMETNILPPLGFTVRKEGTASFGRPHAHKAFRPKLGRKYSRLI